MWPVNVQENNNVHNGKFLQKEERLENKMFLWLKLILKTKRDNTVLKFNIY